MWHPHEAPACGTCMRLAAGECVAVGCVAEAELSLRMGNASLTKEKIERITKCFASYGLPVHVPKGLDVTALMKKMALDKKNQARGQHPASRHITISTPPPLLQPRPLRPIHSALSSPCRTLWRPHAAPRTLHRLTRHTPHLAT
jgi:hypothetical protein